MPDTLTDEQHDWASSFCGIATKIGGAVADAASGVASTVGQAVGNAASGAASAGGQAAGPAAPAAGQAAAASNAASKEDGGLWGALKDAASGALSTVEHVASDVGHTVADAATGVVNTVGKVATGIGHTALDAGAGLLDTAKKVGGDVVSGHLGQALGDAADGIVTTTGRVADGAVHTVVDAGSGLLETAGKVVTGTQRTVADAAIGVVSTAGHVVGDVAQTVAQAAGPDSMLGQAAGAVGRASNAAAGGVVGVINTVTDFNKGVVEGVVGGVEGLATGVVSLGEGIAKEGYALATDEKAREQALATVVHGAEAVGKFEATLITDPGKAMSQVGDAVVSGAKTVGHMAEHEYDEYQKAAASGHGAEFIGKGVGQVGVLVAGAVLTDGASLGAEAGAAGAEGVALLGEGVTAAGELGAAGADAVELGTAATQAARGAGVAEDLGAASTQLAGRGAAAAEDLGTATTRLAQRGASTVEDLEGAAAGAGEDATGAGRRAYTMADDAEAAEVETTSGLEETEGPASSERGSRRQDIEDEFEELQQRHGGQQMEVADEPPSPDLEEPGRIDELDSGHDRTWEREDAEERLAQGKRENPMTPADNRGSFTKGNPGDGRWTPHNPGEYGLEEGQSIPFREGTPDFTEYATETPAGHPGTIDVEGLTGDSAADREATINALAKRENISPEKMKQWLSDNRQRLHHFGGEEMQIVPDRLHGIFHQGGASELRAEAAARGVAEDANEALEGMKATSKEAADADAEFQRAEAMRHSDLMGEPPQPAEPTGVRVPEAEAGPAGADVPQAGSGGPGPEQPRLRVADSAAGPGTSAGGDLDRQAVLEQLEREKAELAGTSRPNPRMRVDAGPAQAPGPTPEEVKEEMRLLQAEKEAEEDAAAIRPRRRRRV